MKNVNKSSNKKSILKKILIGVLCVFVLLFGAGTIFLMQYYPEDETAANVINNGVDGVTITESDNRIVFMPDDPQAGLIFYPGTKVEAGAYAPLLGSLAQKGICCIVVNMPLRVPILGIDAANGIQEEYPSITDWYIGGHSMGASAAAMYLEKNVDDFDGLIMLGSYSTVDLSADDISVLLIYGENDGVLNLSNYEKNKVNLPSNVKEIIIAGGNHAYFGNYGEQSGDGVATITPSKQQEITSNAIIEWIFK